MVRERLGISAQRGALLVNNDTVFASRLYWILERKEYLMAKMNSLPKRHGAEPPEAYLLIMRRYKRDTCLVPEM